MKRCLLYLTLAIMPAFTSCHRDKTSVTGGGSGTRTEKEVVISLRMPSAYATTPGSVDENMVKSAYILAFRADNGTPEGSEPFDYTALAYSITDAGESRYKNLGVMLRIKDYPQKFVIITNAKSQIEDLNLTEGSKTKDEVLAMLEFANAKVWHSGMGSDFKAIPMWGETDAVTITDNTSRISTDKVPLTRMVSRIDVVRDDAIDDKTFNITSLHLYNHLTNGRVAPNRAGTHWNDTDWRAKLPTMPSADYHKVKGPHAVNTVTLPDGSVSVPVMYAFESEAPAGGAASNATCMVIGGIYKDCGKESYYRVDFVEKDDNDEVTGYKHLLRNHVYRINICDIKGGGQTTPDEAFDSRIADIEAEVVEWDEGIVSDVVFDRQYMLGVSQTEYTLPKNKSTDNRLAITTDVPAGWSITNDADWLTITKEVDWTLMPDGSLSSPNGRDDLNFHLEENRTNNDRTANLKVSAGRMSIVVKVIQTTANAYTLELLGGNGLPLESLLFTSYGDELTSEAQTVTAKWTPETEACAVSFFNTGTYGLGFDQRDNPFLEATLNGGEKIYTVQPDDFTAAELNIDRFMEKKSRVNLSVGTGSDEVIKNLELRQIHYDLFAATEDTYPLDGSPQSFTLTTNGTWTVAVTAGNPALASLAKTADNAYPSGSEFYFTMNTEDQIGAGERTMTLTFTYTGEDGRSATKSVVINAEPARGLKQAGDANSYILQPMGEGVEIPLSWANGSPYGERIRANDKVTLKIIWLDTDRGIGPNSVISSYKLNGDGASGKIEVYAGSQEGNALIAAVVDDEIKWSWHIWVIDYDVESPGGYVTVEGRKWMNLNLGAITDTRNHVNSFGLFYQWGRKDPFAPAVSLSNFSQRPLWDESGNPVVIEFKDVTATENIGNAISNPTWFYTVKDGDNKDWSTSNSSNRSNYLWNEQSTGKKTHYDPCPAGWRVPNMPSNQTDTNPMTQLGYSLDIMTNGVFFKDWNAYFQSCGLIHYEGGYTQALTGSQVQGTYWASTTYNEGQDAHCMQIFSTWVGLNNALRRANGLNVRCIQE